MTVDPGLGSADRLLSFALSMKKVDLHNTKFVTVPWRYEGARVAIVEPDADALWAALKADRTVDGKDASGKGSDKPSDKGDGKDGRPASPAADAPVSGRGISVAVYNGTTVRGLAAQAAELLRSRDFTVTTTATASSQDHTSTVIEYGTGLRDEAETTARLFAGARTTASGTAGIQVILGSSYAQNPSASPGAPTPSTVPSTVADEARSADDDPCADLSYG